MELLKYFDECLNKAMIDRESQDARNGAFIIEITATEILKTSKEGPSITTEVTVIVEVSYH